MSCVWRKGGGGCSDAPNLNIRRQLTQSSKHPPLLIGGGGGGGDSLNVGITKLQSPLFL